MSNLTNYTYANSANFTTSHDYSPDHQVPPYHYAILIVFLVFMLLGSAGNVMVFAVSYVKQQTDPSPVTFLIMHLVACWFLLTTVIIPISYLMTFLDNVGVPIPHGYCSATLTAQAFLYCLAHWTEVGLAVNRVVAICLPQKYDRVSGKWMVCGMIAAAWIVTIIVTHPGIEYGGYFSQAHVCMYVVTNEVGRFFTTMVVFVPLVVVGACYTMILIKAVLMARQFRQLAIASNTQTAAVNRQEAQKKRTYYRRMDIALMLFVAFVWTVCCDVLFFVLTMGLEELFARHPLSDVAIRILYFAPYFFSPYTMLCVNPEYRNMTKLFTSRLFRLGTVETLPVVNGADGKQAALALNRVMPTARAPTARAPTGAQSSVSIAMLAQSSNTISSIPHTHRMKPLKEGDNVQEIYTKLVFQEMSVVGNEYSFAQ